MRTRVANLNEAHGKDLRVYDFIADGSKDPVEIAALVEAQTGLAFSSGARNGYINCSYRPDGSLYVAVVLYEACSDGATCPARIVGPKWLHTPSGVRFLRAGEVISGHDVPLVRAPDLTPAQQAAIKVAAKEHPQHRLTGTPADGAVLRAIGLGPETHPHLHERNP